MGRADLHLHTCFSDGRPTPTVTVILESAGWIAAANALLVAFAVGVGSLTGSPR